MYNPNGNSYNIRHISAHQQTEIDRLGSQVSLFWEKELKHYKEYGLTDRMSVVELGSGPGFLTEKLLREFPQMNITCVEIDPILVEYAGDHLKERYSRQYRQVNASAMKTGLPENSCDFAIARLLLEHLPDPYPAAREIYRVLKPGGKAVLIDNDFEMHLVTYPSIPGLKELYEAYCQARSAEGGNPRIGRQLPIILKKSGFTNVDFEIIAAHSERVGDEVFFKSQGVGIPSRLVQDGFLSSKALGRISVQWRDIIKNEDHVIVRQLYMAIGEKAVKQ